MFIILSLLLSTISVEAQELDLSLKEETEVIETIEFVDREYYSIPYVDTHFFDTNKLELLMNNLNEIIFREPINAIIDEQGKIIEEKPGIRLNQEKFIALFLKYFYGGDSRTIKIPKVHTYPRVTSELLADISVNNIGNYITFYDESNEERSHNIRLSTLAINNHVIFPGENFSFNKVVGERTVERGYKNAPVIVKGELAEDIGGGICQVSSTLFNAVSLRGIQMIERYSHSRAVPYVPPGKDATVSWWGPDFVFKNNYNYPILIKATAKNGKMEINIYSADDIYVKH